MKLFLVILGIYVGIPSAVSYFFAPSTKEGVFLLVAAGCLLLAYSGVGGDQDGSGGGRKTD
jgi:hypothetical protein